MYMSNKLYIPYIQETWRSFKFKNPLFQLMGLRGVIAGHTECEENLLKKYATGCKTIVEIGVAEGASALELRRVADPTGTVYLIDPYLPGRIPALNLTKLVAHRYLGHCDNATVIWLEEFSYKAAKSWEKPIDFLFIDGDHSYEGCLQDWHTWSPFVENGGIVAFHDARIFKNGWTSKDWGSVKVVNEILEAPNSNWYMIDEVDSVAIFRKKP